MIQIQDPVAARYARRLQALVERLDDLIAHPDAEIEKVLLGDIEQIKQELNEVTASRWGFEAQVLQ